MSAILFLLVWPIAILCVARTSIPLCDERASERALTLTTIAYWSTRNMRNTWTPMVIKFVYAFFLGLIQNVRSRPPRMNEPLS